jgi:hypothetical protein
MKRCNRQAFRALKTVATEAKRLLVDHLCVEAMPESPARVRSTTRAQISNRELDRLFRACSNAERVGVDLGVGPPLSSAVFPTLLDRRTAAIIEPGRHGENLPTTSGKMDGPKICGNLQNNCELAS